MDRVEHYRQVVKEILNDHAPIPYSHKEDIVLGFHLPEKRPYTEFAVA
jgi:hypothetical protein